MPDGGLPSGWQPRLRILCLHGRRQTSAVFEKKIDRLVAKAASFAEFVFVDGPVELDLQDCERVNTRGWSSGEGGNGAEEEDWAGARQVLARAWEERGPFDGVLGFSEGVSAALLYCRIAATGADAGDHPSGAPGDGLRLAVLAGGPDAPPFLRGPGKPLLGLASLHFGSAADTLVPIAGSRRVASLFRAAEFREHDGGHCFPQRAEDVKSLVAWLQARQLEVYPPGADLLSLCPGEAGVEEDRHINQDQRDELETLAAVFTESEIARLPPAWPARLLARIAGLEGASLLFTLPPAYPQEAHCRCEFYADDRSLLIHESDLMSAVEASRESLGNPSVVAMVQAAQQWAEERAEGHGACAPGAGDDTQAVGDDDAADAWWSREDEQIDEAALADATLRAATLIPHDATGSTGSLAYARECGATGYGRPWKFVVGLVGKPSAGKSTFFNAATRPERADRQAAMAAHPFTTIDPNVGAGWFAAPCPTERFSLAVEAQPEHGVAVGGRRRHPLLVKDVAGLVPGAYLGRGRGNAFLNDLCDADSLVHIVDASGRSDREGVDQSGGATAGASAASDPLDEIKWVRREIHLWIFCNIRAKWESVRKRARMATHATKDAVSDRLFGLFSGYHATAQLAMHVYEAAGFNLANIVDVVKNFTEYDLHLLVACFLRVRFPIVVALNKADVPGSAERIAQVREKLGMVSVPVSARAEWWLCEHQQKAHITYTEGGGVASVELSASAPGTVKEQWGEIKAKVLEPYGSTGVLETLSMAVLQRRPVFVCPVADFSSCEALQRGGLIVAAPLSTMVMLRPSSTVEEAFAALKHEQMLRGDFVRAEALEERQAGSGGAAPAARVLRRDEALCGRDDARGAGFHVEVLRILTNKKSQKQASTKGGK